MATVIHHGGGVGTYKTFAVLQRHALLHLKKGRVIISTIRGFDNLRVIEAVMNLVLPESAEIIFVDLETIEGIEKIRRWWEWVPKGAFVIIDEAQLVYPKSKKITTYDYPAREGLTSEEAAEKDKRPNGFLQAFTMQRHYNWDLAIITPNIKMLLAEIKEVTQIAYEHRYLGGILPWRKHGWREVQHLPLETAKSSVHEPKSYNADKRIYQIYQSTKTGAHTDSKSEQSIFKNPKIVGSLSIALCGFVAFIYILTYHVFGSGGTLDMSKNSQATVQVSDPANPDNGGDINDHKVRAAGASRLAEKEKIVYEETTQFESTTMAIVGKLFDDYVIEIGKPPEAYQVTTRDLMNSGAMIQVISDCHINISLNQAFYKVRCALHRRSFEPKRQLVEPSHFNPINTLTNSAGS